MNQSSIAPARYRFPGMREVDGNFVHESAVVGPDVRMGRGNVFGPAAVVVGNVEMGDDNYIGPHVSIGLAAQYYGPRYELKDSGFLPIVIGSRNTFRECATVHEPSKETTLVEDDCYFMAYTHVSHDTVIRSRVTLSNSVQIGGFTEIQLGSVIGLSSTIHQFTTIGAFSMVGMSSVVSKDLAPFAKWAGSPVRLRGVNSVGLQRNGFTQEQIDAISRSYEEGALPEIDGVSPYIEAFLKRREKYDRPLAALNRS